MLVTITLVAGLMADDGAFVTLSVVLISRLADACRRSFNISVSHTACTAIQERFACQTFVVFAEAAVVRIYTAKVARLIAVNTSCSIEPLIMSTFKKTDWSLWAALTGDSRLARWLRGIIVVVLRYN
jgi:hypothetical protein